MDPITLGLIGLAILVIIVVLLGGAIQTFKRQPIVAILCVIFLLPIWIIWAVVEIILPDPDKRGRPRGVRSVHFVKAMGA